jgi:hypothetical protein
MARLLHVAIAAQKKYPQFVSRLKAQRSALYEVVCDPTNPLLIKLYLFTQVRIKIIITVLNPTLAFFSFITPIKTKFQLINI